jgi:hypothetical protein
MRRSYVCHTCEKKSELIVEEPPCRILSGWLAVSYWKGMESVDHYSFCSLRCLQSWVDSQVPKVPDVFIRSLEDENNTD